MTEAVAWMYERRPEAYPPTKMIVALERRLDIPALQFWTETPLYPAEADQGGWIVGNGDGTKWRTWGAMGPEWTTDRNTATRYYRREDAEAVHRDDEDAWTVVPFGDQAPQASTEAAWCDDTLPCARYTEALAAKDAKIAELERERDRLQHSEEDAWRECNRAVTKVKAWENVVYIEGLPLRAVRVDEFGPGKGDQVAVPEITPKKLTELLERLALKEKNDDA